MISEKEFVAIVSSTKQYVLSAIAGNLPERFSHAIDDIVQETYFRAYRSLVKGAFRNEAKISTWIYVIARNETLRMVSRLLKEEDKASKIREKQNAWTQKEYEVDDSLIRSIDALPEVHREIMRLFHAGLGEREIADRLNIPRGTVKSRLSRAKKSLRKILVEVHGERN